MSKITHTESIRKIFGAAVDGDSASIAYQAEQLAQKLDEAITDLADAAKRAAQHAQDLGAGRGASYAALLSQSAAECAQLSARVEALEMGLFALVQAAGKGKEYVAARAK